MALALAVNGMIAWDLLQNLLQSVRLAWSLLSEGLARQLLLGWKAPVGVGMLKAGRFSGNGIHICLCIGLQTLFAYLF